MQVIRTLLLILITIVIVSFIAINWQSVPLNLWPIENGNYLYVEWPVGLIFIVGILIGFVPMWLLHKGVTAPIAGVSQEFHIDHAVAALDVTLDHNDASLLEESYEPRAVLGHS